MRTLLAAALLALAPAGARAGDFSRESIGTSGSEFLNFDLGARGISLGGAYTAVTNDAYSLYWNPAGLAKVPRVSMGWQYTRWVEDITHQSFSYAQRINDSAVVAGGFRYQDFGNITQTDILDRDVGRFRPRNYLGELGWGQSIYDLSDSEVDVDIGVAVRWLHSDYLEHADAYSGDIGMQARFYSGTTPYDLAFVLQHLGRGQKFDKERDTLPFRGKLGGAVSPIKNLLIAADAVMPINNVPYGALGLEYNLEASDLVQVALRGGMNTLTLDSLSTPAIANFGFGVKFTDFTFDYAFSPLGVLGDQIHRFSVSFNLPAKVSRRHRER